ncbi:MAG: hypothetical protein KDD55_13825, partial [Bdellovibrionales bacterium]|nr:hypothetical protein [Bdellovibrionales bacterium]
MEQEFSQNRASPAEQSSTSQVSGSSVDFRNVIASVHAIEGGVIKSSDYQDLQTLYREYEALPEVARSGLKEQFTQCIGYRAEPVPIVLDGLLVDAACTVASERAEAAVLFLKDIYGRTSPRIFEQHKLLEKAVKSSLYYAPEIVGSKCASVIEWDLQIAMDWVLQEAQPGEFQLRVLESDTGNIGGHFHNARMFEQLRSLWGEKLNLDSFRDGAHYLRKHVETVKENSSRFGRGLTVTYVESVHEPVFCASSTHPQKDLFERNGLSVVGPWNKDLIHYNDALRAYCIGEEPITGIDLRYYVETFDTEVPGYENLPSFLRTPKERQHAIDGFWRHYVDDGYTRWYQTNPLGSQIFVDKGVSSFIPLIVEFYLGRESKVNVQDYMSFAKSDGSPNLE